MQKSNDDLRENPERILNRIKSEEKDAERGRLKIFFGYAAGVGKTYTMLEDAHFMLKKGVDVVVGYIEPHSRPDTMALLSGLETIAPKKTMHRGICVSEFDLDAALERKPELILVDELAHTNAEGSRHIKRYQDIGELLNAGIDVYTTVNVQHVESLNDIVAAITGVVVRERIPDRVFDGAYQVELIDLEPEDLIARLNDGKIYKKPQAKRALDNFFNLKNLVALREIAMRRCADRINKISETDRQKTESCNADEHILVCISPSPSNGKVIRTAARMAAAFRGEFTAVYVEPPDYSDFSDEDKKRLRRHIKLAQQLGAGVETLYGDDVPLQISEFARLSGVTKIVMGRSYSRGRKFWRKPSLSESLTALTINVDIYIILEKNVPYYRRKRKLVKRKYEAKDMIRDIVYSLLVLAAGSLAGAGFYSLGIEETNIIMIYILVVLIISLVTARRYYGIASAFLSVLIFNFLFTEPRFSMQAYDQAYPITFLVMFVTAVTTSSLTMRMKRQARQSAEASFRMKILFDTNYLLQNGNSEEEIVNAACSQLVKLLKRDVAFYGTDGKSLMSEPRKFRTEGSVKDEKYDENHEFAVASWVYSNNKRAGATTDTLGDAKRFYLSVRLGREVFGVAGIAIKNGEPLDSFDNSVMMSILGELALALKNQKETKERERAALNAKNQQLRANLLRSVSHDWRTPLTSIFGNTEILLKDSKSIGEEDKQRIYKDINNDSVWLIKIVENLLSITKIEDKSIELNMTTELMGEVIEEAVEHIRDDGRHEIRIIPGDELLLARVDGRLIMQVIINLIENAQKYTPDGSKIAIDAHRSEKNIIIRVADNGNGIDDKLKETIFNMFFTTDEKAADSNRSMGMGLALCKAIVNAHGGKITVTDNEPKGAVFTFTLPAGEVEHNG